MDKPSAPPHVAQTEDGNDFRDANEQIVEKVLHISKLVRYAKGEQIMISGTEPTCLYYVEEGAVEVSHSLGDTKIVVALIGERNFFGEIGFFDGISRVRDIRATENTVIRLFDQEAMRNLLEKSPLLYGEFVTFLAQSICGKFRRVLQEREPLTAYAASLSTGRRSYFEESKPIPDRFFRTSEWLSINKIVEDTKAAFFDLSHQLQQDSSPDVPEPLFKRCHEILNELNDRLQNYKDHDHRREADEYVWGYVFKEIFPYYMRSRFAERAYYKPRGYAGDYLMMEMIYRNEPDGDGKLGIATDSWCLGTAAARAVRGRRRLLGGQLASWWDRKRRDGGHVRIMNLACGSNRELFDFLSRCEEPRTVEATCVDADPQALAFTDQHVNVFPHGASIRLMNDNAVRWAAGGVRHDYGLKDIIYSAGLTDYLDRRLTLALINRCFEHLKPGGVLIIGNFAPGNPNRIFMDHVLHWKLIYRSKEEIEELFGDTLFGEHLEVVAEEEGVNLFAIATKPG